jgi:hypothetical protein
MMRRALSISLILLFGLPAFIALMPGMEDARLPFCCRRQGTHHCAMETADQNSSSGPVFSAPSRCPQFPADFPATVSPIFVSAASPADWPAMAAGIYSRVARREAARAGLLRAQLDRGPPSSVPA